MTHQTPDPLDSPTGSAADLLISQAAHLVEQIRAEQNKPLVLGQPAFRGLCRLHPDDGFPLRATKAGAREDTANHCGLVPGGHHLDIEEVVDWHDHLPADQQQPAVTPQPSAQHTAPDVPRPGIRLS